MNNQVFELSGSVAVVQHVLQNDTKKAGNTRPNDSGNIFIWFFFNRVLHPEHMMCARKPYLHTSNLSSQRIEKQTSNNVYDHVNLRKIMSVMCYFNFVQETYDLGLKDS